ncbi:MAG: hypothetical protein GX776_06145, partial [Oxalobacter sp.]|nr:hypothetical protein [Oxalobacter sp.]
LRERVSRSGFSRVFFACKTRVFLRGGAFFVAALLPAFAGADSYHEKALFFSYERYEQVLPYTRKQEEKVSPDSGEQPGGAEEKGEEEDEG